MSLRLVLVFVLIACVCCVPIELPNPGIDKYVEQQKNIIIGNNSFGIFQDLLEALKKPQTDGGNNNEFAGSGFMFSIGNLVISQGSKVKMFNQDSDNVQIGSASKVQ